MTLGTSLAFHSLTCNRRQYAALFIVCALSVAVMLSAVSISDGMLAAMTQKAKLYYGGDIQFLAGGKSFPIEDCDRMIEKIKKHVPDGVRFYERFDLDAGGSALFFQGESVRQRMFKGVDFAREAGIFATCAFSDGGARPSPERNTMVISEPIAKKLGARAGDVVTLQTETRDGFTNTARLVVSGVSRDSSLFGMYTSYIDIEALRSAAGYPAGFVNRLCLHYGKKSPSRRALERLQKSLSEELRMYPLTSDKAEFFDAVDDAFDAAAESGAEYEPMYALIPLDSNIKDLQMFIDAMKMVIAVIVAFLMAIIAVGVGSIYRVIIMRRTVEIGTYRAMGMTRRRTRGVFVEESLYLLASSVAAGMVLSIIIVLPLMRVDFSFIPAFGMFLVRNNLLPAFNAPKSLSLLAVICVTTVLSVLFTVRNIVHISPVGALSTTA